MTCPSLEHIADQEMDWSVACKLMDMDNNGGWEFKNKKDLNAYNDRSNQEDIGGTADQSAQDSGSK